MPATEGDIPTSLVMNLTNVFGDETATKRFVTRYIKVTHCELFFADAAILIEGPAERMLLPHFIRHQPEFASVSESYVTWLEIAGSHAHRLRELIETLGLTTLIVTDLYAMDEHNKAVCPARAANIKSRNQTLKTWCPCGDDLDELYAKTAAQRVIDDTARQFRVCVAYQRPLAITFKGNAVEALATTLEDALVYQNVDLFAAMDGKGLVSAFRKAIADSATIDELAAKLADVLRGGGKAEFALDLLEIEDPSVLKPPEYIKEGLLWLVDQLRERQSQLGLPVPAMKPEQPVAP